MEAVTEAQHAEFRRKQIRVIELSAEGDRAEALATWLTAINPQSSTEQESQEQTSQQKSNQEGDDPTSPSEPIINYSGQAWAVLVGVNHYEDPFIADLSVCVQDVAAVYGHIYSKYQSPKLLNDDQQDNLRSSISVDMAKQMAIKAICCPAMLGQAHLPILPLPCAMSRQFWTHLRPGPSSSS